MCDRRVDRLTIRSVRLASKYPTGRLGVLFSGPHHREGTRGRGRKVPRLKLLKGCPCRKLKLEHIDGVARPRSVTNARALFGTHYAEPARPSAAIGAF
jgi:hypothetical protein